MKKFFVISYDPICGCTEHDYIEAVDIRSAIDLLVKIRSVNQKQIKVLDVLSVNDLQRALRHMEQGVAA